MRTYYKITALVCGIVLLMVGIIYGAIAITHTQSAQLGNSRARCSEKQSLPNTITIANRKVTPNHTYAHLCDTLKVTNKDNTSRLMAFGEHENHISYDGISERLLQPGESFTVTLVRDGTFRIHDHEDPSVQGSFTVTGSIK